MPVRSKEELARLAVGTLKAAAQQSLAEGGPLTAAEEGHLAAGKGHREAKKRKATPKDGGASGEATAKAPRTLSTLYITTPDGQQRCSGEFVLVAGETANGQPLWKQAGGEMWLYSGENGMWIIGASDAKEKNFACSRGMIFSRVLHGGLTPDKVGDVWRRLDRDKFVEDPHIIVGTAASRPFSLRVVSPTGQQRCMGEYLLVAGEAANGHPVWKQKGGRHWLYTGSNGTWIIGGSESKERGFRCSRGVIYSKGPHGGVMPDRVISMWLRLVGDKFHEDPAIAITERPMPLYVRSPNGQQRCAGEYAPVCDRLVNGQPLWEHVGGKCWLYSGSNSLWIIGGDDAREKNFQTTRGVIYCKTAHGGLTPDKMVGIWLRLEGEAFREDAAISVSTEPTTLYVVSPHGQQRCAGEYVLRASEQVHGQPAWKQKKGAYWLFSSKSGTWTISEARAGKPDRSAVAIHCESPHEGLMPDKVGKGWQRLDGEDFREDPSISVSAVLRRPAKLHVASPNGQQRCAGEYVLCAGHAANSQPLWKQLGGKCWLYSGTNGVWIIGGSGAKERNFDCSKGVIYCSVSHGGIMPDRVEGSWLRLQGDAFAEDAQITVGTKPTAALQMSPPEGS